jgi:hemoglobin
MSESESTLYQRLGGYDAIAAVAENLIRRLMADGQLGRFWAHRGQDGLQREKQLLIDFLCASAGGPLLYTGRNMTTSHKGMRISAGDWSIFMGHVTETLAEFDVAAAEAADVAGFIESTRAENVEC